jgi:hypothetical protein
MSRARTQVNALEQTNKAVEQQGAGFCLAGDQFGATTVTVVVRVMPLAVSVTVIV